MREQKIMEKVRNYVLKLFLNSEKEILSDEEIVARLEKEGIADQPVIKRTLTEMKKEGILIKDHEEKKAYSYDSRYGKVLYYTVKYYGLNKGKLERERQMQRRLDEYFAPTFHSDIVVDPSLSNSTSSIKINQ